jgi:ankyrin repeat protein
MAGDACIAQLLLDNGAEFGAEDLSGDSPLHTATKYGHLAVAQLLLDNGADISTTNNLHRTSLHIAAENGHLAVAELLLCRGARIQATDCGARTPLYLAACNGHRSTVELLVGREADANPANVRLHVTAIRVAFINGHHQIVRSLLSAVMKTNSLDADVAEALHQAARLGRVRVVELIFGPGAAMSAVTGLGPTRVVERLLEKGPVNSWRDNTTRDWNPRELVERAQWIAILCDQKTVAESGCE